MANHDSEKLLSIEEAISHEFRRCNITPEQINSIAKLVPQRANNHNPVLTLGEKSTPVTQGQADAILSVLREAIRETTFRSIYQLMREKLKPKIFITSWRTTWLHGDGKIYSIESNEPSSSESSCGDGLVAALCPSDDLWQEFKDGFITSNSFKWLFIDQVRGNGDISPGGLFAIDPFVTSNKEVALSYGDTLCCSCEQQDTLNKKCYRGIVALLLDGAGWRVILDGKEIIELSE
ncbi:MAG: hypothetical protein WCV79_04100, partial [Candidatus Paceibacterota bacterium]